LPFELIDTLTGSDPPSAEAIAPLEREFEITVVPLTMTSGV
jgi:hypothetical protein